jgi:hypothetical protein
VRKALLAVALAVLACGVKAPPRPPTQEGRDGGEEPGRKEPLSPPLAPLSRGEGDEMHARESQPAAPAPSLPLGGGGSGRGSSTPGTP